MASILVSFQSGTPNAFNPISDLIAYSGDIGRVCRLTHDKAKGACSCLRPKNVKNLVNGACLTSSTSLKQQVLQSMGLLGIYFTLPAGIVHGYLGSGATAVIGGVMTSGGYVGMGLSTFLPAGGVYPLLLCCFMLVGFGSGAAFLAALSASLTALPRHPGSAVAACGAGMSLSLALTNLLVEAYFAAREVPAESEKHHWPSVLVLLSVTTGLCLLPGGVAFFLLRWANPRPGRSASLAEAVGEGVHSGLIEEVQFRPSSGGEASAEGLEPSPPLPDESHSINPGSKEAEGGGGGDGGCGDPDDETDTPLTSLGDESKYGSNGYFDEDGMRQSELHDREEDAARHAVEAVGAPRGRLTYGQRTVDRMHAAVGEKPLGVLNCLKLFYNLFFLFVIFGYFCGIGSGIIMVTGFTQIWGDFTKTEKYDEFPPRIGIGYSVTNAVAGVVISVISDWLWKRWGVLRHHFYAAILVYGAAVFALMAVLRLLVWTELSHPSPPLFVDIFYLLLMVGLAPVFGASVNLVPSFCSDYYGYQNFGIIFSLIQVGAVAAVFGIPSVTQVLIDSAGLKEHGGYFVPLTVMSICCFLSSITLFIKMPSPVSKIL